MARAWHPIIVFGLPRIPAAGVSINRPSISGSLFRTLLGFTPRPLLRKVVFSVRRVRLEEALLEVSMVAGRLEGLTVAECPWAMAAWVSEAVQEAADTVKRFIQRRTGYAIPSATFRILVDLMDSTHDIRAGIVNPNPPLPPVIQNNTLWKHRRYMPVV